MFNDFQDVSRRKEPDLKLFLERHFRSEPGSAWNCLFKAFHVYDLLACKETVIDLKENRIRKEDAILKYYSCDGTFDEPNKIVLSLNHKYNKKIVNEYNKTLDPKKEHCTLAPYIWEKLPVDYQQFYEHEKFIESFVNKRKRGIHKHTPKTKSTNDNEPNSVSLGPKIGTDICKQTPNTKSTIDNEPNAHSLPPQQGKAVKTKQKMEITDENNKKKKRTSDKISIYDDIFHKYCKTKNSDAFNFELKQPTLNPWPFKTFEFAVKPVHFTEFEICLAQPETNVVQKENGIQALKIGLDFSFEERCCLYSCLKEGVFILIDLCKDYAIIGLKNDEKHNFCVRYNILKWMLIHPVNEEVDKPLPGNLLKCFYDKNKTCRLEVDQIKEPIYHKFKTVTKSKGKSKPKKDLIGTLICSKYYCDICKDFIDDDGDSFLIKHFNEKHEDNDVFGIYAEVLTVLVNKRNKTTNNEKKKYTSSTQLVDDQAKITIRLTMKHINLPPSATDIFKFGSDYCMDKLNNYFDEMKGGAIVYLKTKKGDNVKEEISSFYNDNAHFYQDVLDEVIIKLDQLKKYPWNELYAQLPYENKLKFSNQSNPWNELYAKLPNEKKLKYLNQSKFESEDDKRTYKLYGLITGCVYGIYDQTTHPVLNLNDANYLQIKSANLAVM